MDNSAKHEAAQNEQHPWIEEALQGIDDIDWHSPQHAYGPADDVPGLLRLQASGDEAVREDAWEHLYSNIWHQGTVYEASPMRCHFCYACSLISGRLIDMPFLKCYSHWPLAAPI